MWYKEEDKEASKPSFLYTDTIRYDTIGPASYIITSSDLATIHPDNSMIKYADDTYLIIPASGVNTRAAEINNITNWATVNNLTVNMAKMT